MSEKVRGHFDAWGNPILDYFGMKNYYVRCDRSTKVLNQCMPHRYVVIPHCEIRVYKGRPGEIEVITMFPAGDRRKVYFVTDAVINALRRLYKAPRGSWKPSDKGSYVSFYRSGFLLREPAGKYGSRL